MLWHWDGDSAVFDGVSWLQGLWASRSAVCLLPLSRVILSVRNVKGTEKQTILMVLQTSLSNRLSIYTLSGTL